MLATMTKSYLGRPDPLPYVDEDDLVLIAGDLGAGVFPSDRIYGWYVSNLQEDGRLPVSKTKFGRALQEAGWLREVQRVDGKTVRCWMINKPWARRGAARALAEREAENGGPIEPHPLTLVRPKVGKDWDDDPEPVVESDPTPDPAAESESPWDDTEDSDATGHVG